MIFRSDLMRTSGASDWKNPTGKSFQIYALSIDELNLAAGRVRRHWDRGAENWDLRGQESTKPTIDEEFLNRPIKSLNSEKLNPAYFTLSWPPLPSMAYRTRSIPRILVPESEEQRLYAMPSSPALVKHAYCVVAGLICRETYFLQRWEAEGVHKSAAHARYRAECETFSAQMMEYESLHPLLRANTPLPKAPALPEGFERETYRETIESYFTSHKRRWLVRLLRDGLWEDSPESNPLLTPQQSAAYTYLNSQFSKIDLGRNSYMQFSSNPGPRQKYARS